MSHRHKSIDIDSLQLKALSVPSSLRFLLGVEYDVVLCVTEVGGRKFSLNFPVVAETFRKLLSLCACRFMLECRHTEQGSVLTGTAVMPLLRYADYIPGALHVGELMECLLSREERANKPTKRSGEKDVFDACLLDYANEFTSDACLNDVHGLGFYLTQDYGLSMASHRHLVELHFHEDWDVNEALREFQEFSGWEKFDLRFFDDENKKKGGIVVFPSVQDACDLLDKYEDEDSDDEGDLLSFYLRPVCPLVPVPFIEDALLRKLRDQHWQEILAFWERFPKTKNLVVLFNLYDGATLEEVLSFIEDVPIEFAVMVEDASPAKRRRVFVKLANPDATKKVLAVDGRSTKGKTLRVHVSPPYISKERWGTVLCSQGTVAEDGKTTGNKGAKTEDIDKKLSDYLKTAATKPAHADAAHLTTSPHLSANAKEFVPSFALKPTSPEFRPAAPPQLPPYPGNEGLLPPPPSYEQSVSPHLRFSNPPSAPPSTGLSALPPPYALPATHHLPPPSYDDSVKHGHRPPENAE
ncbi:hypothetical protein AGDE_12762 [Angomonas deanei]|uniref:Uncharacterized protein n=1 Tax=Angomonas deanei TaxID=59799 RepID=A0A7G2CAZ8_9TRYP|nr:hypothetical protein AGDE_12762 [Angomonas deanei]CAD2216709.1 hypothetical protein, conserved [Angomonas deanei]|eukprot:EPY23552.1 hypothetical protein AGDE_12762 [Angomonas deanei]